jgi:uncharacterized protein
MPWAATTEEFLEKSKHNILAPVPGQKRTLIANLLYGTADLLTEDEALEYKTGRFQDNAQWIERGYLVEPEAEAAFYKDAYLTFIEEQAREELQIFFVPTYACNFGCDYCYQDQYESTPALDAEAVMDAFFAYIDKTFAGKKKYLTLFGGEPLLPGARAKEDIRHFLDAASARGLETAVVTNGYHIEFYIDILKKARIREVQVTLDGLEAVHDQRRPLKGGGKTFSKIVEGIDLLLDAGIPVNLRMVLDRENIDQLYPLARLAAKRGWTENSLFKTQIGRNYELHHCSRAPDRLYSRLDLYRDVVEQIKKHPEILSFHAPAFHFVRQLKETGEMPLPNFDACPGAKSEWAFDCSGHIYSCTATVGKKDEALGTFYPDVSLNEDAVFDWQDRNVPAVSECRVCEARLVCGAGCASLAKNRTGRLLAPDCRPVAELAALGVSVYFSE